MIILAYDHREIIMTDRVPRGKSVTIAYYHDWMQKLRRKMHKNRPDLLRDGPLILHDDARPHLGKVVTDLLSKYEWEALPHAPYSPDMSPPEFDLFHELKEPMRGHRFPTLEEVSAAVTRAIRRLNKSSTLNGLANLPKRWDAVIEKQED
jgi:transposase